MAIAKAGKSAGLFSSGFDATVFTNLVIFGGLTATYENIGVLKSKLAQQNSGAALEGTNFIVKYMGDNKLSFTGGNYYFESYQTAWARYVDVEDRSNQALPILYEFKSIKPSSFNPVSFTEQFVKDLKNDKVSELSQIKWIFDHSKMNQAEVKTKVLGALNGEYGLEQLSGLGFEKATKLFPNDELMDETNFVVRLINNFSKEEVYNNIFK